jgi:hypothetical protein
MPTSPNKTLNCRSSQSHDPDSGERVTNPRPASPLDSPIFEHHFIATPSARPPSIADLFVGGDKLRDLHEVVGLVVTNFGGVEETLRYLDWQLQAFALGAAMPAGTADKDVQIAFAAPRNDYFAKHMVLSKILKSIDKGLAQPVVATAMGADAVTIGVEWQKLRATADDLGKRRNALAHAAIGVSGASIVRNMGLLAPAKTVNPLDDKKLTTDIGAFRTPVGSFINKLTRILPFRDHNTVTFSEPAEIVI